MELTPEQQRNYPRPALFYRGSHSPCEHFALLGYEHLAAKMDSHRLPDDEQEEADPDARRRAMDAYVLAALINNEPPKKTRKPKKGEEAPVDESFLRFCGLEITWHIELPRLKVWAGNMSLGTIIGPRLRAVQERAREWIHTRSLFDFTAAMRDEKSNTPIGASGLDPRSVVNAIDAGFSPSDAGIAIETFVAAELLAIIGLQIAPITRLAWDEYLYMPDAPLGEKHFRFRLVKRDGGYLRNFSMAHPDLVRGDFSMERLPMRQQVIQRAADCGMTAYAVAVACRENDEWIVSPDHVKAYFNGEKDMTSERLDAIVRVLWPRVLTDRQPE